MKAKPNEMQAEQQDQPAKHLPIHTKGRSLDKPPQRERIGAKLKTALKAIVWEGQDIAPAAKSAGLTGNAVRIALARPHVKRFVQQERDVFIAHARAQNVHHAVRIRECGNAAAEIRAVVVLEELGREQQNAGGQAFAPGITIIIGSPATTGVSEPKLINGTAEQIGLATPQTGKPTE